MTILQILIAAVLGIAAGFATHALVPDSVAGLAWAAGLIVTGLTMTVFAFRGSRGARVASTARSGSVSAPPVRNAVSAAPSKPAPSRVPSGNFEITVEPVDGAQKVTVIVKGFSGSDWKSRVRPAIERVSSVKWDFPKNLGDGRRQLTGTVRGGNSHRAVADIRTATERFGG